MTWLWVALTALFLAGAWLFSLWRWPFRRDGSNRTGARLVHHHVAQHARRRGDDDD